MKRAVSFCLGLALMLGAGSLTGGIAVAGAPEVPEKVGAPVAAVAVPGGPQIWVTPLPNDNGRHLTVRWTKDASADVFYLVFRTDSTTASPPEPVGGMYVAAEGASQPKDASGKPRPDWSARGEWMFLGAKENTDSFADTVPAARQYRYAVMAARAGAQKNQYTQLSPPVVSGAVMPATSWFDTNRWFFLLLVVAMAVALYVYTGVVKKDPDSIYIRRIPGVDAIEDSVGRSTEMGRPVLYVTGVEEIQNIQTIASLLILGHVSEMIADYDTEMKVANFFPLTMVVAEEIVKQGFANAGRLDAHKPENVMFITAEQFAFAAGVNGLILRDKPATNIYLGRFFAESLMLAETGYVTKAVQIAGTAEITQLPFFIAACDYTIIGEELYAVSAYLSREPSLLATLKATDMVKLLIMGLIVIGALAGTFSSFDLGALLVP